VGGGGRWFAVSVLEVKDDASSMRSHEGVIVHAGRGDFSEEDTISPKFYESERMRKEKGKVIVRSTKETGVQKVGHEDLCKPDQCLGSFNDDDRGNVDIMGKRLDVRGDEVDMYMRQEGGFSIFIADCLVDNSLLGGGGGHAPEDSHEGMGSVKHAPGEGEETEGSMVQGDLNNFNVKINFVGLEEVEAHFIFEVGFQGERDFERG